MPQFARDTDVIDRLKDDVTTFAHLCHARGLVSGTGGNVSARLPGQHTFWITATGVPLRRAAPSDCVEVSLDGVAVTPGLQPSKECRFHAAIYRQRPGINAVAHVHPPFATAFAIRAVPVPLVTVTARARFPGRTPLVATASSGSIEPAHGVEDALRQHPEAVALLLREHGIVAIGKSVEHAYHLAELLEETAQTAIGAQVVAQMLEARDA